MNVQPPKVLAIFKCFSDGQIGKVLVLECYKNQRYSLVGLGYRLELELTNDFLLSYKECQLVFAFVGQAAYLHAADLGAYVGRNVID